MFKFINYLQYLFGVFYVYVYTYTIYICAVYSDGLTFDKNSGIYTENESVF